MFIAHAEFASDSALYQDRMGGYTSCPQVAEWYDDSVKPHFDNSGIHTTKGRLLPLDPEKKEMLLRVLPLFDETLNGLVEVGEEWVFIGAFDSIPGLEQEGTYHDGRGLYHAANKNGEYLFGLAAILLAAFPEFVPDYLLECCRRALKWGVIDLLLE